MSRKIDIENLMTKNTRRLQKLRERQAKQGISTPPEVLTEIEDIEAGIAKLEVKHAALEVCDSYTSFQ